ncbi:MAG TPA: group II intron reverse transcriptase/maturase [Armatimonadota bacterium]|jgi:RNA-directed DNA polymerase
MEQKTQRADHTQQLAFVYEAAGEAQPVHSEGTQAVTPPVGTETGAGRQTLHPVALADGLMEAVVDAENMRQAHKRVRTNKGSPGIDSMTVKEMAGYLKTEWPRIRLELLAGTYKPQPVKRVEIPKPDGGVRELGIPTVVDRLIQQAVLQVLTPLYDPTFSEHSYGFRPGRSAHQALLQAREYVAGGKGWVVDLDLEKFFDRVNHDVLMGRLRHRIGDKRLLKLIRGYLTAGVLCNGVVFDREEGTPQGGPLSPLLANVLLDDLDKELERRGHCFCRYADDCNIYVHSERAGQRVMASVTQYLERKLRLKVNQAKSAVARPSARKFLGYRLYGRGERTRLLIAHKSLKRAKDTIRRITRRNRGVSLLRVVSELRSFTDGWVAYYHLNASKTVFEQMDQWIRRRVRCYQWKQWKTPRNRARQLRKAGIGPYLAWGVAYDGPGLWRAAGCPALSMALNNAKLIQMGFSSLAERYHALKSE